MPRTKVISAGPVRPKLRSSEGGFSLIEMLLIVVVFGIVTAAAVPMFKNATDGMKLGQASREVERELQAARLKSVSTNRPIRVRFNCPAAGQYRTVEVIGSTTTPHADDANAQAARRCNTTIYPYPPTDQSPITTPNHDGPVRTLTTGVTFANSTPSALEFWPDGSVHKQSGSENPWLAVPEGTAAILVRGSDTKNIAVNSVGKIRLQ